MKRIFLILFFFSLKLLGEEMPCSAPPGVSTIEKPNVLIVLDVTGSMRWRAAASIDPDGPGPLEYGDYSPNYRYYGYFHPDSIYQYQSQKFVAVGYNTDHSINATNFNPSQDKYLGNILNWACMSRIDVAKKVLTGGKGLPLNLIDKHTLIGEGDGSGWPTPSFTVSGTQYRISKPGYGSNNPQYFYVQEYETSGWRPRWRTIKTYRCYVDVSGVPVEEKCGVIRKIADKDFDGQWDQGKEIPRFGLFFFSTHIWELPIEFYETEEDPDMEPFINAINNIDPAGGTPVGNAVLEAIHYISYVPPHFTSPRRLYTYHGRGTRWDPMYSGQGASLQLVPCRKNFVILIGDGESNSDTRVSSDPHFSSLNPPFSRPLCDYDGDAHPCDCSDCGGDTDHPADDYAYFAHVTDLRNDIIDEFNNIDFYAIFAFGRGVDLFKEIAKDGGFQDRNGNLIPDLPEEYDKDEDGIPDNYYEAESGEELEEAIKKVIYEIMARVSSGTAVSIITQTSKAEGLAAFASYYPVRYFGSIDISWIGVLRTLFVDKFGFIREDNNRNRLLELKNDYVVSFYFDPSMNQTFIIRYKDVFGNGDSLLEIERVPIEEMRPVWDGSEVLLNTQPNERNIWTFVDKNSNGIIETGELKEFNLSNLSSILPHLDIGGLPKGETLIRYIRGEDFAGKRRRTLPDGRVWKLGDIIFSTPLVVGPPQERYDLIYGDATYRNFYIEYRDRRVCVYVGANDGMIHVFNSGKLIETNNPLVPLEIQPAGFTLGGEIFAYIPFNLLPHLKWLMRDDYCHVYYVDLKPYPTDVKIFEPSPKHPEGWGTVIIGGMRLGGTPYETDLNLYSSSFFLLDVTDPEDIVPLWERKLPDESYTTSFPATCKVGDNWFLVIGSGPTNLSDVNSDTTPSVYVLKYSTGGIVRTFTLPDNNSFIGDIISVDYDLDYNVERIYFGTHILDNPRIPRYNGKLYKIETYDDPNPDNWTLHLVFDSPEPIITSPSVGIDERGRIWLYFGTGRFYTQEDADYTETQYLIGVRDEDVTYNINDLLDVTDYRVFSAESVITGGRIISFNQLVRDISINYKGWVRRITDGERCITNSALIGGTVLFTTYKPEFGPCRAGGTGYLYALYYLTGTAYYKPIVGETASGENLPGVSTGPGMPAEPTVYVGKEGEKVFVQTGTGGIIETESALPFSPNKSRVIFWKGR